jgi:hypothetical protein
MWRVNLFIFTISEKIETFVQSNSSKSHIKSHLKHLITIFLSCPQLIHIFPSSNSESTTFKLTSPHPSPTTLQQASNLTNLPQWRNQRYRPRHRPQPCNSGCRSARNLLRSILGATLRHSLTHRLGTLLQRLPLLPSTSSARIYHTTRPAQPKLVSITANILSPDCADLIARTLETEFDSHVDILVNNAAIMVRHKIGEIELGYVEKSLLGNVQTPILMVETLVRKKLFRPNVRIVNISSDAVREGRVGGYVWLSSLLLLRLLPQV